MELTESIGQMWSLTHSSVCAVCLEPAAIQHTYSHKHERNNSKSLLHQKELSSSLFIFLCLYFVSLSVARFLPLTSSQKSISWFLLILFKWFPPSVSHLSWNERETCKNHFDISELCASLDSDCIIKDLDRNGKFLHLCPKLVINYFPLSLKLCNCFDPSYFCVCICHCGSQMSGLWAA